MLPVIGVRDAQKQLADENPNSIYYIDNTDMEGSTTYFDSVHYGYYAGYDETGERIFSALKGETRDDVKQILDIKDVISWTEFFTNKHTVTSGNVVQWQSDISPNTTVLVPHTNAPLHIGSDPEFNNKTVIEFDPDNGETLKVIGLTGENDWTIFSVAKIDDLVGNQYLAMIQDVSSANRSGLLINGGSNRHTYFYDGGASDFDLLPSAFDVGVHTFCFTLDTTGGEVNLYVDGVFAGTDSIASTETGMTEVWVGSLLNTSIINGRIAAFGFIQGTIATATEAANMHAWAAVEYDLPG